MTKQLQVTAATEAELFKENFANQVAAETFETARHCSKSAFDYQEPVVTSLEVRSKSDDDTVNGAVDALMGMLGRVADHECGPTVSRYAKAEASEILPSLTIVENQPALRLVNGMNRNSSAPNIIDVSSKSSRSLWVVR